MKTIIIAVIALIGCMHNADAQKIYTVEKGITYRVTGVNGVQINPDGTVLFLGGKLMMPATFDELITIGTYDSNEYPPMKQLCSATSGWMPLSGGGLVWGSFFNNVCGPYQSWPNGPSPGYKCMNANLYLCQARWTAYVGLNDIYLNTDCN